MQRKMVALPHMLFLLDDQVIISEPAWIRKRTTHVVEGPDTNADAGHGESCVDGASDAPALWSGSQAERKQRVPDLDLRSQIPRRNRAHAHAPGLKVEEEWYLFVGVSTQPIRRTGLNCVVRLASSWPFCGSECCAF